MILYLVRHGETVDNKFGLIQGQRDVELSDKGRADAATLKDLVKSLDIDVVISSPLSRAVDTAKIITDGKYPINTDDRITERNWGMIEGVKFDTVDSYKNWNFNINTNDNYIEPLRDFLDRLSNFIEDIRARYKDSKVLVVAHSGVLRGMHYIINGIPMDGDLLKIDIPNLRIIEYEL